MFAGRAPSKSLCPPHQPGPFFMRLQRQLLPYEQTTPRATAAGSSGFHFHTGCTCHCRGMHLPFSWDAPFWVDVPTRTTRRVRYFACRQANVRSRHQADVIGAQHVMLQTCFEPILALLWPLEPQVCTLTAIPGEFTPKPASAPASCISSAAHVCTKRWIY
jgi:hypothetical protein